MLWEPAFASQRAAWPKWGRTELAAPFLRIEKEPIGDIRFEPSALMPEILVKCLFNSAELSV
jgi:mannose-6-phosphate isomerase